MSSLSTSFAIARRELRGGLAGFRIFLACLILGVAIIATMGSITASLFAGMAEEGQSILGGDIELALVQRRATHEELAYVTERAQVSEIATLRALARPAGGTKSTLIEIKAVDDLYPFYGELTLQDGHNLATSVAQTDGVFNVAVDSAFLTSLKLEIGDLVRIGRIDMRVAAVVTNEPDRLGGGFVFGPRVFMSKAAVMETQLIQPGSLVRWRYRLKLPQEQSTPEGIKQFIDGVEADLPKSGWRVRGRANAAPGAERFIERLNFFMTLAGLTALIVGGVGVANAIKNFLDSKRRTIATFKCLGATGTTIFQIYLCQIMMLAAFAIAIALALGALVPALIAATIGNLIPIPIRVGIDIVPLIIAAAFGVLVTLAFSIWPLGLARELPGAVLFRSIVAPQRAWPKARYIFAIALALGGACALALWWYDGRVITAYYLAGTAVSFIVLWALGQLLIWAMKKAPRIGRPEFRLAINNIHRPGSPAPSVMLSLGLGLALIVTLALIDNNLSRELKANIPDRAPSFFFVDIQPNQVDAFTATVKSVDSGAELRQVPMMRGRIISVKSVLSSDIDPSPEIAWALRGDRGLTYAQTLPDGSKLTKGEWWAPDYEGKPLVSVEAEIAIGIGLDIGDEITVNVLGRDITATVANLRELEWESFGINFVLVFSPSALRDAPHTFLSTVTMDADREVQLLERITADFPSITAIRMKEAIQTINAFLQKLLAGIRGASALTLVMSVLVLAGALASGYQARLYDAAILKAVGATRRRLIISYCAEYIIYGAATSVFALIVGAGAAYSIIRFVMDFSWKFDLSVALGATAIATTITLILGIATSWRSLGVRPARILRTN